jgi:hypothetical protein
MAIKETKPITQPSTLVDPVAPPKSQENQVADWGWTAKGGWTYKGNPVNEGPPAENTSATGTACAVTARTDAATACAVTARTSADARTTGNTRCHPAVSGSGD